MDHIRDEAPLRIDRRKRRTRRQLLDATIELLLQREYQEVMTDEITELADVGRRTFYNHFENKRECVLAAISGRYTGHAQAMLQSLRVEFTDATPVQQDHALDLANMASRMFLSIALDPITEKLIDHPRILIEAVAESQRDFIVANVAGGMEAGVFQLSIPVESLEPVIAWGFVGLVIAAIPRRSQQADSHIWTHFLLQNLGIQEDKIGGLLERLAEPGR